MEKVNNKKIIKNILGYFLPLFIIFFTVVTLNFIFDRVDDPFPSDVKENTKNFFYDYKNIIEYPQLNESREVLHRMLGDDWFKIGYNHITVEKPTLPLAEENIESDFDKDRIVELKIYAYDYGKVYIKAKEKTDIYIKENQITNKKEKNQIFNKNLSYEYEKFINEGNVISLNVINKALDGINGGRRSRVVMTIKKRKDQKDNMDLYNALSGGLIEAMEKDPCDYLIIRDEYKYYEELKTQLEDYKTDIVKGKIPKEYQKSREIMSAFYVESTGDMEKDIEHEFRSVGFSITDIDRKKEKIELVFDSKDYGKCYEEAIAKVEADKEKDENLSQKELNERFTKYLTEASKSATRIQPKIQTTVFYDVIYDDNGECHYKLLVDDSFYELFFWNLIAAEDSNHCKYDVVERKKYVDKRKQEIEEIKERVRREREAEAK
ncbi:hypothetical protein [Anaerofustis sp.]|uniref:hypothetical protein n=1 Tax=Anaerofustis sp. TaxID=1872517 RepID=UPI0025C1A2CF|nr:hypothetical protein [Anaerofustis sp.]